MLHTENKWWKLVSERVSHVNYRRFEELSARILESRTLCVSGFT
jgi:hypothetical protein